MKKDDNFNDHKLTNQPRFDGDLRSPLDMGKGSKKVNYVECPGEECKAHISYKQSTVRVICGTCGTSFDPHEQFQVKSGEVYDHNRKKPSQDYMKFRRGMEKKAENYVNRERR